MAGWGRDLTNQSERAANQYVAAGPGELLGLFKRDRCGGYRPRTGAIDFSEPLGGYGVPSRAARRGEHDGGGIRLPERGE